MADVMPQRKYPYRRVVLPCIAGLAIVLFRTYQDYSAKGHLDTVDVIIPFLTIAMLALIIRGVAWWYERQR